MIGATGHTLFSTMTVSHHPILDFLLGAPTLTHVSAHPSVHSGYQCSPASKLYSWCRFLRNLTFLFPHGKTHWLTLTAEANLTCSVRCALISTLPHSLWGKSKSFLFLSSWSFPLVCETLIRHEDTLLRLPALPWGCEFFSIRVCIDLSFRVGSSVVTGCLWNQNKWV